MSLTLQQIRDKIENEVMYLNKKPYSHNIIGWYLEHIKEDFGREEMENAVYDFDLHYKGWSHLVGRDDLTKKFENGDFDSDSDSDSDYE
jgi:hypothetical protein